MLKDAIEFIDSAAAERIDNSEPLRVEETSLDVGQFLPQGDVALVKLASVPSGAELIKNPKPQIADGSTKGARHCWDSMQGVKVYREPGANALTGCVYVLSEERTLTHPEHANHIYHAGFIGRAIFQRAMAAELRRVQD